MICSKCGEKGKSSDRYCGNCGAKLEKEKRPLQSYIDMKIVWIVIAVLMFLLFVLGIYQVGSYFTSPKYIATKYFEKVIDNDYSGIYRYIDEYSDSPFVSKEILQDKTDSLGTVKDYEIVSTSEMNGKLYVEFQYEEDGQTKSAYVVLTKEGRRLLLYDRFKVESGKVATNVTLRVLKGSTITVDDKEITSYLKEKNSDEYYDAYVIPAMIKGEYTVKVTLPNGLTMDKKLTVDSSNTYTLAKVELTDELKASMEDEILKTLNTLYDAALNDKAYSDIKDQFTNNLEGLYRSIKRSLTSSKSSITKLKFTDVELTSAMFNQKGRLEVDVYADYDMTYTYTEGESKKTKSTSDYMSLAIEFKYEDKKFSLFNIANSYAERGGNYE